MAKSSAPKAKTPELPHWEARACKNIKPDFFNDDDEADYPNAIAHAACVSCDIRVECLAWAMQHERFGIWGDTTSRQREKLKRPIMRVRCPGCASNAILEEPTSETCLSCGLSWKI